MSHGPRKGQRWYEDIHHICTICSRFSSQDQMRLGKNSWNRIEKAALEEMLMAFDETLAALVRQALARKKSIEEKKMFGGIGFLLNGNLLVGVRKYLILRLGSEEGETALLEPHVKVFDITGRVMKGWVIVARDGIKDETHVKEWIQRAVKFVGKLPAKEK